MLTGTYFHMDSTEIYTSLLDSRPMRILQAGFRMWGADVLNGRPLAVLCLVSVGLGFAFCRRLGFGDAVLGV